MEARINNTAPQNGRLLSVDLVRGLAVFFMIAVHTLTLFGTQEVQSSIFGDIINFLGSPPAAPVFMTMMGLSLIYSHKKGLKAKLLRGFLVFLSGYLLNLLRFVIPFEMGKWLMPDMVASMLQEGLNARELFFSIDILQFAGIALMIMAVIQYLRINKWIILSGSLAVVLVSPLLWGISTGIPEVDFFLDLLWGDRSLPLLTNAVAFPAFPWLAFPLLGMFLGETIKASTNHRKTFKTLGLAGLAIMLAGALWVTTNPEYQMNDYFHSRPGSMLFMCGFVMVWLWIADILIERIPPNPVFNLIYDWSRGVTNIYFIHWIILGFAIGIFGMEESSYFMVITIIAGVTFISYIITKLLVRMKKRRKEYDKQPIR